MTAILQSRRIRWYTVLISAAMVFGGAVSSYSWAADRRATEAQLKELREKISQLQQQQQAKRQQESEVRHALAQAEVQVAELSKSLQKTQNEQKAAQSRLKNLDQEKRSYERQRDTALKALTMQIRAAFTVGKQEYLKLLLNQDDPSRLGRTLMYYEYLNRARTEQLTQLSDAMSSLVTIADTIGKEILALTALEKNLLSEKQKLASTQAQRKRILKKLSHEIANQDKQIASLTADEQSLTQLLDRIGSVAKRVPLPKDASLAKLRGKLSWPSNGKMLHQFGESRHEGRLRWNGVLIDGKEGSEVSAIYHGRIVFSDWLRGFGLMTIVDHGDDYMSLYGHNQTLLKQVGDWVEAGEPIATMGNTGGQTAIGLYFEIRHKGKAINPKAYCQ